MHRRLAHECMLLSCRLVKMSRVIDMEVHIAMSSLCQRPTIPEVEIPPATVGRLDG